MPRLFYILLLLSSIAQRGEAQVVPPVTEQQLENLADLLEIEESGDDNFLQQLEYFKRYPLNINTATVEELRFFKTITDLQIQNLINYRRLFGNFVDIYELQAVPAWNVVTIRRLLPYLTVATAVDTRSLLSRFREGEHYILVRNSRILETSRAYDTSLSSHYLGGRDHLFFRYKYQYKNLLQYGITGDKDAGEQFFKGAQAKGFDFYSAHLFARQIGIVKAVALGDYTVNMGQGLIQWGSLAFKKSSEALAIKRQSALLQPYSSAGEFNFNRGAAITIQKGAIEATAFGSFKKISSNSFTDTLTNEEFFSSLLSSGFHRNRSEIEDRNNTDQTSFGGNVTFQTTRFRVGVNAIHYQFSKPLQKRDEPYNFYAVRGKSWSNYSVDYSFTYRNVHFFGEAAVDKNKDKAFINGAMISLDPKVDVALLYRNISPGYQSLYGNAFTENTAPTNEKGFYTGITIRPVSSLKIDAYADFYRFPFLKFRTDAPSHGQDYLLQLTYQPNKQFELYTRYRKESKEINESGVTTTTNFLVAKPRQNLRLHLSNTVSKKLSLRNRVDAIWFDRDGKFPEQGFLVYTEVVYKPNFALSANLRLQYFETDGFNSRIYTYENDVLYSYSIPVFSDKGFRYYVNLNYDISKKLTLWLRWAQTVYKDKESVGSGIDELRGNKRSEIKAQVRYLF